MEMNGKSYWLSYQGLQERHEPTLFRMVRRKSSMRAFCMNAYLAFPGRFNA